MQARDEIEVLRGKLKVNVDAAVRLDSARARLSAAEKQIKGLKWKNEVHCHSHKTFILMQTQYDVGLEQRVCSALKLGQALNGASKDSKITLSIAPIAGVGAET